MAKSHYLFYLTLFWGLSVERIFAELDSGTPGPLIVVIAALHGNEHVGFHAVERVLKQLTASDFIGKIVGITGNLEAANRKERFIEHDLNRFFLSNYLNESHSDVPEWHEARELIDTVVAYREAWPVEQPLHLLDMHSMSGEGIPFTCFPDLPQNARLAHQLPLPAIAELVEILPGTLVDYFADKVDTTMVVECGQHDADITQDIGEAALACFLRLTDCLQNPCCYPQAEDFLRGQTRHTHEVFTRVKFRYHIHHQGLFTMQPGYQNFQTVKENELLGRDKDETVKAPFTGRMILPCYQKQCADGFFLAVDEE